MFKNLFFISFVLILFAGITTAQNTKDYNQKPQSFENPYMVSGPQLESPLADFYESFEGATFPPAGWVKYSPDGGTGWEKITAGTTPLPGWNGGTAVSAPVTGSGTGMAYATWTTGGATSNNQWLVSPQINNVQANDTLKFWMRKFSDLYLDNVEIKLSTTGNAIADFTISVQTIALAETDTGWVEYKYVLGDYVTAGSNIYIAWREFVADNFNDGAAIFLDEVSVVSGGGGGGAEFVDNFDSYTAGVRLCTQTTEWQTWSGATGNNEDPFVSSAFSWSSPNSIVIVQDNDVVRKHGSKTTGKWYMSFHFYIPAGKSGYFNNMNGFAPNPNVWGMDSYFDVGGTGRLDTTGGGGQVPANVVSFNWTVAQWNQVIVIIDLDAPDRKAEYWIGTNPSNLTQVATWNWTQNGTKPTRLDVTDLFGAAATDEMYVDNFYFGDAMPTIIPVELTSFAASVNAAGHVILNWTTGTEINNLMFEVERSAGNNEFVRVGYVNGQGTTSEPQAYSFTDAAVSNGTYFYRLKQIDFSGMYEYSNVIEVDVKGPLGYNLSQNYPNPFNPSTVIDFSIVEAGMVKLTVYNLLGEEIQVLRNEYMESGFHQVTFDALNIPSGMYIYKLETANYVQARKMMLMK